MKQFKTERAVQQQKLICVCLIQLMGERPYEQITVSDLCRHSGIPRRTFYYYYEGKEEVLKDLMRQIMQECELEGMFHPDLDRRGVEESFARFFRYWSDRRRRELEAIVKNDLGQMLVHQCMEWIPADRQWDMLAVDVPEERRVISTLLSLTCLFYTLFYWHSGGYKLTPEQLGHEVTDLLTRPIYHVD